MSPNFSDFVAWDVTTWSRPLHYWENCIASLADINGKRGLEVGANQGGLSLFFASQFGCPMTCTDCVFPEKAKAAYQQIDLSVPIEYSQADVLQLPFSDESFDFVVFKSLLGVVGSHHRFDQIKKAMLEIHRVLKPGGRLFFAENLRGSVLHTIARQWFVSWGNKWHYLSLDEIRDVLRIFSKKEVQTTGFLAAFVPRPKWLKNVIARCDPWLFFIPAKWHYVAYGHAIK